MQERLKKPTSPGNSTAKSTASPTQVMTSPARTPAWTGGQQLMRMPVGMSASDGYRGSTLPYREATELLECVRIMGEENAAYCRQVVLGETPEPGEAPAPQPQSQQQPTPAKGTDAASTKQPLIGNEFALVTLPLLLSWEKPDDKDKSGTKVGAKAYAEYTLSLLPDFKLYKGNTISLYWTPVELSVSAGVKVNEKVKVFGEAGISGVLGVKTNQPLWLLPKGTKIEVSAGYNGSITLPGKAWDKPKTEGEGSLEGKLAVPITAWLSAGVKGEFTLNNAGEPGGLLGLVFTLTPPGKKD